MNLNEKLEEVLNLVKKFDSSMNNYITAELTNVNNSKIKILGLLNKEDLEKDKRYLRLIFPLAVIFDKQGNSNIPIIPVNFNEEESIKEAVESPIYISGENFLIVLDITDKYELIKEFILRTLMFELQMTLSNAEKNTKLLEKMEESIKKVVSEEQK